MITYQVNNVEIKIDVSWLSKINSEQINCIRGVYSWNAIIDGSEQCLYIGTVTDANCSSITSRFLGELLGSQISSNKGISFDTDFTVSACLGFLNDCGYEIIFKKESDKHGKIEEVRIAIKKQPLLQNVTEKSVILKSDYKMKINDNIPEAFNKIQDKIIEEIKKGVVP